MAFCKYHRSTSILTSSTLTWNRTLFFLFYFNRVIAAILSCIVRTWTWHKYRVYIDVKSFQISILAGRLFFKGFRYHGNNQTLFIQSGYITWRYWLRNFRQLGIGEDEILSLRRLSSDIEKDNNHSGCRADHLAEEQIHELAKKLPCRLVISLKGVEWFIYNNSLAYDNIVTSLANDNPEILNKTSNLDQSSKAENSNNMRQRKNRDDELRKPRPCPEKSERLANDPHLKTSNLNSRYHNSLHSKAKFQGTFNQDQEIKKRTSILRLLPIQIECEKAAVVVGNHNTRIVLITKIDKAAGRIDASNSLSKLDLYRQFLNVQFEHPTVQMKPNYDYTEDQVVAGSRVGNSDSDSIEENQQNLFRYLPAQRKLHQVWHMIKQLLPSFRNSIDPLYTSFNRPGESVADTHSHDWQGLSRYLDEDRQDDNQKWASIEYATVSTILESLSANMEFYWDAAGYVRDHPTNPKNRDFMENVNGEIPPEWGINLTLGAATVNYGPWADRQRVNIQKVFFPGLFKDAFPAQKLTPGQMRIPTDFKLEIIFDEESILRVPLKEESKNWKWTKQTENICVQPRIQKRSKKYNHKTESDKNNHTVKTRPFGWLDLKIGAGSVVRYCVDLVPGPKGYLSNLEINLPTAEITTSVNHGLLWKSTKGRIFCDLPNPLKWNASRSWIFDISTKGLELFILREHIFLLTDLISDWTNGPPPDYITFCPYQYFVNLHFEDFRVYFNVNDSNIINDPSDFDDNTFIILLGATLDANISIPLDNYRAHRNDISFDINMKHGRLDLHVPPWNTHASFLSSKELANLKILNLHGKFQYCPTVSPSNTDTLLLDLYGHSLSTQTYGFAVRYLHKIRDNYFGDDIQFKTLEEHQRGLNYHKDQDLQKNLKRSNDMDIIMGIHGENFNLYLPSNLYTATYGTCIAIKDVALDLRFNNYFMDVRLDLSTIALSPGCESQSLKNQNETTLKTQLSVDGFTLFENRLFGLPPSEPTYVCNRDCSVGVVIGECTTEFLRRLASGIKAFLFSFNDDENVLPLSSEQNSQEVTFFRANLESLNVRLRIENSDFFLSTENIAMKFNNWAGPLYSKKLEISVPSLKSGCIDTESASRHKYRADHQIEADAMIQASFSLVMIEKSPSFERDRQLQQEHIQQHDQRTHRCDFLLHKSLLRRSLIYSVELPSMKPPSMPYPTLNRDFFPDHNSMASVSGPSESNSVGRKHSFLSLTNSSTKSRSSFKVAENSPKLIQKDSLDLSSGGSESCTINQGNYNPRDSSSSSFRSQQTSFYSAISENHSLPHPSTPLNDPKKELKCPILSVETDKIDVPKMLIDPSERFSILESQLGKDIPPTSQSEGNSMHTSYMISFNDTIRGFCNPKGVYATTRLLSAMQAITPDDILDELQIESINEILDGIKSNLLPKTTFDLGLQAPSLSLRFLNSMTPQGTKHQNDHDDHDHDQFDISISGLAITFRSENDVKKNKLTRNSNNHYTMRASIASIGFVVKEISKDMDDTQATISCFIEDFIISMTVGNQSTANVRLKGFELVTSSRKVGNLASVLHRVKSLAANLSEHFSTIPKQQHDRIMLFTHLVITNGQQAKEPLFLTRPSYVLRFTTGHVRTQDSWTIISRLHYLYNLLDQSTRLKIASSCARNSGGYPDDAKQDILTSLAKWSGLDIKSMENCVVISKILNKNLDRSWIHLLYNPFLVSLQSETYRLVIDPGPKQNIISMLQVALNFEKILSTQKADTNSQETAKIAHLMVLGVFLGDLSICLNWELYEMFQDIFQLREQNKCSQASPDLQLSEDKLLQSISELNFNFHVVLKIRKVSLSVDAINVRNTSSVNQLELSYIVTRDKKNIISNLIVVGKTASANIKSFSQELILIQLQSPGVCVSYQTESEQRISINGLKIAANCHVLECFLKQDITAMIEVMDHIVIDEISQIQALIRLTSHASPRNSRPKSSIANISIIPDVSIALFLDKFYISVQLLQSLNHDIFGNVARASVATQLNNDIVFDFDIKDHSHKIQISTAQETSTISLFRMLPTNGRIIARIFNEKTVLSVFASVEPVILDAAVLHTLLSTMNKQEFLNMIANLQNSINHIENHLKCLIFSEKSKQDSESSQKKPLLYDAHLTFAGFEIFANASNIDKQQKIARLELNLGCVQMVAINCHSTRGSILKYPELRISLHQMFIKLARGNTIGTLESCGSLAVAASATISSKMNDFGFEKRSSHLNSNSLKIILSSNTASTALDVIGYLQDKIKDIDLSRENNYLRKFRKSQSQTRMHSEQGICTDSNSKSTKESESVYSLELMNIQVCWLVENYGSQLPSGVESEDLVLSLRRMEFSTKKQNSAQLKIQDLQLQMVSSLQNKTPRSLNSAMLPEVIFNVGYVSTEDARRLAFQAGGKSLDLRLTSCFMVPASALRKSFVSASEKLREASAKWTSVSGAQRQQPYLGKKRLESLLIDADFAGAIVHLSSKSSTNSRDRDWGKFTAFKRGQSDKFVNEDQKFSGNNTVLRSPGLACKIEYKDRGVDGLSLNADVKVDASSNILYPSVVPLILEMSSTVKDIVSNEEKNKSEVKFIPQESLDTEETKLLNADPSAVLNRTRLNLGLRICGQEFGLSCQPIARVAATAQFEDIYIAVNTVRSIDQEQFFTASAIISKLNASVQHVYSREPTGSFHVEKVILSLMNSKHVGSNTGLAAILKISPMKLLLNAKQLQDFLLFREIWMPPEIRKGHFSSTSTSSPLTIQPQTILMQRYQQVAATGAFPWNAIVSIAELDVKLDLGQAIGRSAFIISNIWLSSKKTSAWEQNLCLGIDKIDVESIGRMSGLFGLQGFKLRTSIQWPDNGIAASQTPLVQGSIAFQKLYAKAAFDYQAFLVVDIELLHFLMYNVRNENSAKDDRLMAILEADVVQVFCTTTSSSQALALYQAFRRLILEKRTNLEASLLEIEKSLHRSPLSQTTSLPEQKLGTINEVRTMDSPISLHTDVLVTLKALSIGAFPTTFLDHQVFKLEALDTEARFAVGMNDGKIRSTLGLTLGQLRIGLADIKNHKMPKSLGEISVDDVVDSVTGSRGGTILKVPKVEAIMQTWQAPRSNHIDYIFKSYFEGKVEVGWNYSRISYIRGMWAAHSKALARQLGKPLPLSAVRITGVPDGDHSELKEGEQQKITAEVNVPQSKYDYNAIEPPIIETPQLRDMGEATPP